MPTLFKEIFAIPSVAEARALLSSGLPSDLRYHTPGHTDDVIQEAVTFAAADQIPTRDIRLLAIAAAWHDTGYLERFRDNEAIGARLARAAMEAEDEYSDDDIRGVETMILDTRLQAGAEGLRQIPSVPLSQYLIDADVSNLGRDDFFEKAELVREELKDVAPRDFYLALVGFVSAHRWYSPAAIKLREKKKAENVIKLREMIQKNGWA